MVNLDITPCINCKNYAGVKNIGATGLENQYISCKVAERKNAQSLLKKGKEKLYCEKYSPTNDKE